MLLWIRARPDYKPLVSYLGSLRLHGEKPYWIEQKETQGDVCDTEVDTGQESTGVEILLTMSHNTSTIAKEYMQGWVSDKKVKSPSAN